MNTYCLKAKALKQHSSTFRTYPLELQSSINSREISVQGGIVGNDKEEIYQTPGQPHHLTFLHRYSPAHLVLASEAGLQKLATFASLLALATPFGPRGKPPPVSRVAQATYQPMLAFRNWPLMLAFLHWLRPRISRAAKASSGLLPTFFLHCTSLYIHAEFGDKRGCGVNGRDDASGDQP